MNIAQINAAFEAQAKGLDLSCDGPRYLKAKTARAWSQWYALHGGPVRIIK